MKVLVIGAGLVGQAVAEALHGEHEVTMVDTDEARLRTVSRTLDCRPVHGDGASRRTLQEAGVATTDLLLACTPRDEANIVAAMLARRLSKATTVVRMTEADYLDAWREGDIDVDLMVSSELETAHAILRVLAVGAARQADEFADGRLHLIEFDVPDDAPPGQIVGRPLREAAVPPESRVLGIIRAARRLLPTGSERILPGDRVVVIGTPDAARSWSGLLAPQGRRVTDAVVFGGGRVGTTIARVLAGRDVRVRLVEPLPERARAAAEAMPEVRVLQARGFDAEFLARERVGHATAAVFAMGDDPRNLYGAILARQQGVPFTIAVMRDPESASVFELGGIDVAINPRMETAEAMIRFSHNPRVHQLAMLDDDRFEVLDITVRADSPVVGRRFREMPVTGEVIGAMIRGDEIVFPHADDVLEPGDRAIVLVDAGGAAALERAL